MIFRFRRRYRRRGVAVIHLGRGPTIRTPRRGIPDPTGALRAGRSASGDFRVRSWVGDGRAAPPGTVGASRR
ncbi:hypothetical protein HBB16_01085 [Pseudonocardia sp. MCCB 268]|nr:hypothetical protein [Pseudonocardia cytotoxica]